MTDTHIAKLMWDAYAIQAGGITFDGKPLPTWDELGEDRQSCWVAAASVTASRIEKLEAAVGGAYSWIDRWAKHVPNCRAPMRPCTCGRDAVMYEASKALEGKDD